MVKKRIRRIKRSYENYIRFSSKLAIYSMIFAIYASFAMIFVKGQVLKISFESGEPLDVFKGFANSFSWLVSLTFLFFGVIFGCYYFLKKNNSLKNFSGIFLVSSSIFAFFHYPISIYVLTEEFKNSIQENFFMIFVPKTFHEIGMVFFFFGVLFLGIFLLYGKKKNLALEFFATASLILVFSISLKLFDAASKVSMYASQIKEAQEAGQVLQISLGDLYIRYAIPIFLENLVYIAAFLFLFLLSFHFLMNKKFYRRYSGYSAFAAGFFSFFSSLLSITEVSLTLQREIPNAKSSILQNQAYTTLVKTDTISFSSMTQFYLEKFFLMYADEISKLLAAFSLLLLGVYLARKT